MFTEQFRFMYMLEMFYKTRYTRSNKFGLLIMLLITDLVIEAETKVCDTFLSQKNCIPTPFELYVLPYFRMIINIYSYEGCSSYNFRSGNSCIHSPVL